MLEFELYSSQLFFSIVQIEEFLLINHGETSKQI